VYGALRVTFDLIDDPVWWWGLVAMALGMFSALYGVVFAAAQTDMKRLLAFSSIENVGLMFTGFGLALVFQSAGMSAPAALALIAVLYHAVNHAFMKGLLFVGTGAVLHATGQRNLGRLGGLIRRMPWVAWPTLIGALAIAGLPPLNGFVSEWLLLQAFLSAHEVPRLFLNMLLPLGTAVVALAAALAGYVMVKFFGVVFLGQRSRRRLARARRNNLARGGLRASRPAAQSNDFRPGARASAIRSARARSQLRPLVATRSRRGPRSLVRTARLPHDRAALRQHNDPRG
jgi:formate hydrogenlyase subunit 3/multisubunit Na+/H+ antiporter MnhD subunit